MITHQHFNDLLEQYVFKVAEQFIESASPEGQTQLINLLLAIDKPEPANILPLEEPIKKECELKS